MEGYVEKTFWIDPYQKSLVTKVVDILDNQCLFEKTIAYSFSDGQESDRGYINNLPILESRVEENIIYYTLFYDHGLLPGDEVLMTIDWPRRYSLMRLRFAAELILEIVRQKFYLEKVGIHVAENKGWIDFIYPNDISLLFDTILETYNGIVLGDYTIQSGFSNEFNHSRFWKIDQFREVLSGGAYLKSTKEAGFVSLKRARSGRTIERIEIRLID
jgi:Ser-tRNA(Ala) deacylase AlaX